MYCYFLKGRFLKGIRESKVQMVLMTHFSRKFTDECLRQQQKLAESEDQICCFAKEGKLDPRLTELFIKSRCREETCC